MPPLSPVPGGTAVAGAAGATALLHIPVPPELAVGALAAAGAVRVMRRRALHWSWAALALLAMIALARELPHAGTVVLAAAGATIAARRRHRAELDAGGDLAGRARSRRTPLDLLSGRLERLRRQGADARELVIGRDERGRPVRIAAPVTAAGHTLVLGATGAGKTVTQARIAGEAILGGAGAIVVDPKGDERLRAVIGAAAAATGRLVREWTPAGPSAYNPFARGGDTEVADRLLAGEPFSEPHYLRQAQRYIGHEVRLLRAAGREVSLREIVAHLEPEALEHLLREVPGTPAESGYAYLDGLTPRQRTDLSGVRDRLAIMAESDVGPWLETGPAAAGIDLLAALRDREVVYFSLEADTRPLLARMLAAAIVADLVTAVAALQQAPTTSLVVIDEFSALAAEQVARLFGRARSAGVSLLLGTQELADLRPSPGGHLLEQVLGNLSVLIAHRQAVPASAELVADMSGARGAWRTSRADAGRTTRTRVRERVLDPAEVMRLAPGQAAVIPLARGGAARITRVGAELSR